MFQPVFMRYTSLLLPPIIYLSILICALIKLNGAQILIDLKYKIIIANLLLFILFLLPSVSLKLLAIKTFILTTPSFLLLFKKKKIKCKVKHIDKWYYYIIAVSFAIICFDIISYSLRLDYSILFLLYTSLFIFLALLLSFYLLVFNFFKDADGDLKERIKHTSIICVSIVSSVLILFISYISDIDEIIQLLSIFLFLFIHLFISANLIFTSGYRVRMYRQVFQKRDTLCDNAPIPVEYSRIKTDMEILTKLIHYFDEKKPYLNKDLTITSVAAYLCTNRTYVSKALNSRTTKNFNEFVNFYRVKEICELYLSSPNKDLIDIMEECGFNNFTSANNAFKSCMGLTPKEWIKIVTSKIENGEKVVIDDFLS